MNIRLLPWVMAGALEFGILIGSSSFAGGEYKSAMKKYTELAQKGEPDMPKSRYGAMVWENFKGSNASMLEPLIHPFI